MSKSTKNAGAAGKKSAKTANVAGKSSKSASGAGGKPVKVLSRVKKSTGGSKSLKAGPGGSRDAQSSYELLKQMSMGWPGDGYKSRSTGGNKVENLEWMGPRDIRGDDQTAMVRGGIINPVDGRVDVAAVQAILGPGGRAAVMHVLIREMQEYRDSLRRGPVGGGLIVDKCIEIVKVVLGDGTKS